MACAVKLGEKKGPTVTNGSLQLCPNKISTLTLKSEKILKYYNFLYTFFFNLSIFIYLVYLTFNFFNSYSDSCNFKLLKKRSWELKSHASRLALPSLVKHIFRWFENL